MSWRPMSMRSRLTRAGADGHGTRDRPPGCTGLFVESLLGLRLDVDKLHFDAMSSLPDWKAFKVHYRYRETIYHISVLRGRAGEDRTSITVDGVVRYDDIIPLVDDRQEHFMEVRMKREGP